MIELSLSGASPVSQDHPSHRVRRRAGRLSLWPLARVITMTGAIAMIVALLKWPAPALRLWWGLVVPLLPAVFLAAPGLWRNSCPLLPIQRLYGQMPFARVRHTHCQPCVGCARNCVDLAPERGPLADHYHADRRHRGLRRLFAAAFPGLVLGYFLVPAASAIGAGSMLAQMMLFMALSIALFTVLDTVFRAGRNVVPAAFALLGFDFYYWHAAPIMVSNLQHFGLPIEPSLAVAIRTAAIGVGFFWLHRVMSNEQEFLTEQTKALNEACIGFEANAEPALVLRNE
ncbi:MAG: hypothetical protein R3E83_20255 [Burkholderiaceae bacterium]